MAFGMWMIRAEMWACTGFTQDPGASYFSVFSLDGAVKGILRFVLGNLEMPMHGRCLVVSCASGTQHPPTGQTSILTRAAQLEVAAGGHLGGTVVKRLPSAQSVIPALWDRAPHQTPPL